MKKTLIISVLLLLFAINSMALNAPTLSSPNNNLENCYSRIAFSWSSVSGASYVLEVDTCPEFNSALLRHISVTSTSRTEYNFLYGTTYYWRVMAISTSDNTVQSDWSETRMFTTMDAVTLNSPSNNTSPTANFYSRQNFKWSSSIGSSSYILQLDTVPTFNSGMLQSIDVSSSSTFTDSYVNKYVYNMRYGTMYYWRVCAVNTADTSGWSETWQFHTIDKVTLSSPSNDTSPTGRFYTRQEFKWENSIGSTLYILQLDTVPTFNSNLLRTITTTNSNSNTDTYLSKYVYDMRYGTMYYWRVCAANAVDTSGWSSTWQFHTVDNVTLYSPNDTSSTGSYYTRQNFQWKNLIGSSLYIIELDTTPSFNSGLLRTLTSSNSNSNTDTYISKYISDMRYGTMYYWRVCAANAVDTSGWSATWQLHTTDRVVLYSLSNDTSSTSGYYTRQYLEWNNNKGSSSYILQLDTTPNFNSNELLVANVSSSTTNTDTYKGTYISNMLYGTMYYWRVCAVNAVDTSGWSSTWQFHTTDKVILYSFNDTSSTSGYYTRQYLEWNNNKGSSSYILQLDTTPNFNSNELLVANVSSSTTNTDTYKGTNISNMLYGTMYYWRVCAVNAVDTSGWSSTWQFHTIDKVVLYSPSNNSTGLSVSSRTLQWYNNKGSSSYIVQVDTTTNFNSVLLRNLSVSSSMTNTDTYKSTSITNMRYGTTYYWRVRAVNAAVDTSGWSAIWKFTTAYQLTSGPTLISPVNDSVGATHSNILLAWQAMDNVNGYHYEVSTSSSFENVVASGNTTLTFNVVRLQPSTTYYWRVQAYDNNGNSPYSTIWHFTTADVQLVAPVLLAPADNSTITQSNITLSWQDVFGALGYDIQLSIDENFAFAVSNYNTAATNFALSGLPENTTFFWRVRSANNNAQSEWSDIWQFTIGTCQTSQTTLYYEMCYGSSYDFGASSLTQSGTYSLSLTNQYGCDSVVTLYLTVNYPITRDIEVSACESYGWNGQTYTESGNYVRTFTATNGCDSVVTLHLTINQPQTEHVEVASCESYNWNGTTYTASGSYQQTFTATNGCDSVVTLHLTINHPTTAEFAVSACDSYVWNGETYIESGNYTQTFIIANGCDSVVTLHLTINHPQIQQFEAEACNFYVWNGVSYNESGDYVQTLSAATGCDSVVTLHLVINEPVTYEFDTSVNEAFVWNGETFTETGDYTQAFTAANGCDSIVTLHLNVITGIFEAEMQINIFPNPVNDILNITSSEQISEIEIVNALGQVVKRIDVNADNAVCDVEDLTSGVYVLRIYNNSQVERNLSTPVVRKFVKK